MNCDTLLISGPQPLPKRFQASAAMLMKSVVFWVITRRRVITQKTTDFFQSEFSTGCDLVLPLSISSIFSFPYGHPAAAYVFSLIFP
jgi:hypothetical protein